MTKLCRYESQYCVACCGLKYEPEYSKIINFMNQNTNLFYNATDLNGYASERIKEVNNSEHICIYLGFLKPDNEPGCLIYPDKLDEDLRRNAPGAKCEPETICELMKEFQTFSKKEKEKFRTIIRHMNWLDFSLGIYEIFCQFRNPRSKNLKQFKKYWDCK